MPRRTVQRLIDNELITDFNDADTKDTNLKKPVSDFLKNNYFEMLKKNNENTKIECPVCFEEIDCKHCFCLLNCGHYLHLHEWFKIPSRKCPICR